MNPYRHLTIFFLIGLCAVVFFGEQAQQTSWAEDYGAVPAIIVAAFHALLSGQLNLETVHDLSRLVTALFLHGNPEHIVYNMVFLWTFGYLASLYLGQWVALAIFLITGICGNILQVVLDVNSPAPIIGASGAISGFFGIYLGLALQWRLPNAEVWPLSRWGWTWCTRQMQWRLPNAEVWPLAYAVAPIQLGAFAVLGFLGDIYFLRDETQGIAFDAHIGGFLSGLLIANVITTIYRTQNDYERRWL